MAHQIGPRELAERAKREEIFRRKAKLNSLGSDAPKPNAGAVASPAVREGIKREESRPKPAVKKPDKRGRGRPKTEGQTKWEKAGLSRSEYYRRQAEKAGK